MATQRMQPKFLTLGKVDRPHGIRGELRMRVFTDYPERLAQLDFIYLARDEQGKGAQRHDIEAVRAHQDHLLLKLVNVSDRSEAELLRSQFVLIDLAHAVPLEDDEFYLYELIGMEVVMEDGQTLGTISDIIETGANDVYVVRGDVHGEVLVPIHDETLLGIDVASGCVTVRLPEGLLPEITPEDNDDDST